MQDLTGKYAIVTGGGKGIGAAIVNRFLLEGAAGVAIFDYDEELATGTANSWAATFWSANAMFPKMIRLK